MWFMFKWPITTSSFIVFLDYSAGIFNNLWGARNRVGIGLSYRPDRPHMLAELIPWNWFLYYLKCKNSGSIAVLWIRIRTDPHSFWSSGSGSGSALGKRIRIQEGQNNPQKWRKFKFWSARCSLLRDEDFWWSLDVFYGGLGLSKLQFWSKKKNIFFFSRFPIFSHQNPGSRSGCGSGSALTKNAGYGSGSVSESALKPMRIRIGICINSNSSPVEFAHVVADVEG